jgi:hypothetical protein
LKFKHLVIIFNIVIIFFLSAIALLPVLFMGPDFALVFWQSGWPLALILFLALVVLNVFFLQNYRLFMLLEREDWPALVDHLEQTVLGKGRYSYRKVRLLVNSYLVMSDSAAVLRLESKVAIAKPALLESNALAFGAARILGGDLKGAAEFFQTRLEKEKASNRRFADTQWIRWFYGFSLVLASVFDKAEGEFKALASASNDAIVAGLSAYFLANTLLKHSLNPAECRSLADSGHERVKKTLKNIEGWKKESAKVETEVHAAIIKKYIDEAGIWLFRA